jgi:hypothetical protein
MGPWSPRHGASSGCGEGLHMWRVAVNVLNKHLANNRQRAVLQLGLWTVSWQFPSVLRSVNQCLALSLTEHNLGCCQDGLCCTELARYCVRSTFGVFLRTLEFEVVVVWPRKWIPYKTTRLYNPDNLDQTWSVRNCAVASDWTVSSSCPSRSFPFVLLLQPGRTWRTSRPQPPEFYVILHHPRNNDISRYQRKKRKRSFCCHFILRLGPCVTALFYTTVSAE